ncbi:MAG: rRNA maturation RNase YbeY [Candidatus Wildermuthbacteria bacterium]|nr:rRNA maturation RNase YbeY [Candidatus Wildermuthbacteria bacterium]
MVEIRNATKIRVPGAFLKVLAREVFAKENLPEARGAFRRADVSVVFLGEKEAQALNKLYRGKTYVPNVLSFEMEELGLGEIVLCPTVISQDAKKYGITFKQELARVFVHGLLHLLGFTHKQIEQKTKHYL